MRPGESGQAVAPSQDAAAARGSSPAPGPSLRRILARASIASLLVKVSGAGLAFLLYVLLARLLGPEHFGDYAFAWTWVGVLGVATMIGMDTAALRFVPAYLQSARWPHLRGFVQGSIVTVAGSSALVGLIGACVVIGLGGALRGGLRSVLLLTALLLPLNAVARQLSAVLQGLKHVALAEAPNLILRPVLIGGGCVLLPVLAGTTLTAIRAMSITVIALLATLVLYAGCVVWLLPSRASRGGGARYEMRVWLRVGLPLMLLGGFYLAINRTDVLMVGLLRETTSAGVYLAGSRVAEFAVFGLMAVNMVMAPLISELHSARRHDDLQRAATLAARGSAAFSLGVAVILVVAGEPLLELFGPTFGAAYVPMIILLGAHVVSGSAGSVGFLMTMTGNEREAALIFGGAFVLNVLLNGLLIPWLGLGGAATATALTVLMWNVVLVRRVRDHVGVVSWVLGHRSGEMRR